MSDRCVIIGASPDCDADFVRENVRKTDFVVCADGGYVTAGKAGVRPDLIIGDFDSAAFPRDRKCDILKLPRVKDDTDTMVCIRECIRRGYEDFLLLGMTGGRDDHTFANYSVLLYLTKNGCSGMMRDRNAMYFMLSCEKDHVGGIELNCMDGQGAAVFPFGCAKCVVTLEGFRYNAEKLELKSEYPIGVSNVISEKDARVFVYSGNALVMVYRLRKH